jgi:hypothetical protein
MDSDAYEQGGARGKIKDCIIAHVRHFGLTTIPAVVRATGANRNAVRSQLQGLIASKHLIKHTYAANGQPLAYFCVRKQPWSERWLRERHAWLWFCLQQERFCKYLTGPNLAALAEASGLPTPHVLPRGARTCRCGNSGDKRIGLISMHSLAHESSVNLNVVVAAIDRMASEPKFALWQWLARFQRFTLVHLVSGQANAAELGRWLRRRPPVARALTPPVPLEVESHAAAPLRPEPFKDQKTP